jgi:hypothetical protein
MDIAFFTIWVILVLSYVLMVPVDKFVTKLNDDSRLKKWWKKHITDWDYND